MTVGTTMPFDELLEAVDRLLQTGALVEPVICQAGQSKYRMSHAEQFVGRPTIDDLIADSSLVISHGGATVIQLLLAGKPFVAFPNPRGAGDHQTSFLRAIAELADISWSSDVRDLARLVAQRQKLGAVCLQTAIPRAADAIRDVLRSLNQL